jgi:hypothetical protein
MKRIIRLTESDLTRIVRRVISEQMENVKIGQSVIELDDQTYEGVKKTFTGNWIALNNGTADVTLTKDMFELPVGGSVPESIVLKPGAQTPIPFSLTIDPANTNQASIFRFLKQNKSITLSSSVMLGDELVELDFMANFTNVSGVNESYRRGYRRY